MIADHYSVIVIPKDRAKVRRWHVTRPRLLFLLSIVTGLAITTLISFLGFSYYKGEFDKTASLRARGKAYETERQKLLARLGELEAVVQKTEVLAVKLETVAGLNEKQVKVGLGPLDNTVKQGLHLAALDLKKSTELFDETSLKVVNLKSVDLQEQAEDVKNRLEQVFNLKRDPTYFWSSMPTVWPVDGWVTSDFGMRRSPLTGNRQMHAGVDIAAPYGAKIVAPGDGVVTFAGFHGGYGRAVIVDHGYGISTMYGHTAEILVKAGDTIKRGMVLAKNGSSGQSTGPHLHYEVLVDGVPTNPMKYIVEDQM